MPAPISLTGFTVLNKSDLNEARRESVFEGRPTSVKIDPKNKAKYTEAESREQLPGKAWELPVTTMSQLPHVTSGPGQIDHATSARKIGENDNFHLLQRFHQPVAGDKKNKDALPTHDSYMAASKLDGTLHDVTAEGIPGPSGQVRPLPQGKPSLAEVENTHYSYTVGAPKTFGPKEIPVPPLSPRSREREIPDSGYARTRTFQLDLNEGKSEDKPAAVATGTTTSSSSTAPTRTKGTGKGK